MPVLKRCYKCVGGISTLFNNCRREGSARRTCLSRRLKREGDEYFIVGGGHGVSFRFYDYSRGAEASRRVEGEMTAP